MTIEETTYAEILAKKAKECPDRVAFCSEGQCYTYAELDKITDVFAAKIIGFGIKKNDHVALWGYNCANWFVTYLSIIKAGAVAVLLNYSLPVKDLADLMELTDAKFIFYGNNRETSKDVDAAVKLAELSKLSKDKMFNFSGEAFDFKTYLNDSIDTSAVKALSLIHI